MTESTHLLAVIYSYDRKSKTFQQQQNYQRPDSAALFHFVVLKDGVDLIFDFWHSAPPISDLNLS